MYGLRRRSIIFLENVCYVIISSELGDDDPKTATSGLGRAQHVVIEDPVCAFRVAERLGGRAYWSIGISL